MAVEIISVDSAEDVPALVKSITTREREKLVDKPLPEESELTRGLKSMWEKSDFGCQRPHVAQTLHLLVKAITGEDVDFPSKAKPATPAKYAMAVLLTNNNSHSYRGEPFVWVNNGGRGLKKAGACGNSPGFGDNKWRYATDEEVDAFFEGNTKACNVLYRYLIG